jgi:rSAM/selenodomain-associated transferase 2
MPLVRDPGTADTGSGISVVIPTLNEAARLPHLVGDLAALSRLREVIVADGGSLDGTPAVAAALGCRVVNSECGRGTQLRQGVAAATSPWLLVLHADVRLSAAALAEADTLAGTGDWRRFGSWRLRLAAPGTWLRMVENGAALRWRLSGLAYGDQGLLVHRTLYDAGGGYPDHPIMEDVALIQSLTQRGVPVRFSATIEADARRYQREGAGRRQLKNLVLVSLYLLGVSPARLAAWYRPEPAPT